MVHVDYTAKGGPLRLATLLPQEAEKLQRTPFAVIQVWCIIDNIIKVVKSPFKSTAGCVGHLQLLFGLQALIRKGDMQPFQTQ